MRPEGEILAKNLFSSHADGLPFLAAPNSVIDLSVPARRLT
jgi:hypothetical protein